jgi:hypothetical protein
MVGQTMPTAKFDKPKLHHDNAGVAHVRPADILQSRSGQAEIQKAAQFAISRNIRVEKTPQQARTAEK